MLYILTTTYNEEDEISQHIAQFSRKIVILADSSSDATVTRAKLIKNAYVINCPIKGIPNQMNEAIKRLSEFVKDTDFVAVVDVGLNAQDIAHIEPSPDTIYAGVRTSFHSFIREIVSYIGRYMMNKKWGELRLHDPTCGYRIYPFSFLKTVRIPCDCPNYLCHAVIAYYASKSSFKIKEFNISKLKGRSQLRIRDIIQAARWILRRRFP